MNYCELSKALGYIVMGLAMLTALPVFEKRGFQKWVRISFLANAMVTPLITFVYFYPVFSEKLLFLGFPWGVTAPLAMLMLALMFKRYYRKIRPAAGGKKSFKKMVQFRPSQKRLRIQEHKEFVTEVPYSFMVRGTLPWFAHETLVSKSLSIETCRTVNKRNSCIPFICFR